MRMLLRGMSNTMSRSLRLRPCPFFFPAEPARWNASGRRPGAIPCQTKVSIVGRTALVHCHVCKPPLGGLCCFVVLKEA